MNRIEKLATRYEKHALGTWSQSLPGAQKVIFIVYPPEAERTLRAHLDLFRQATEGAGRKWTHLDATGWFAEWIDKDDYRDDWFEDPEGLEDQLDESFLPLVANRVRAKLQAAGPNDVVSLSGTGSLYGFLRVSNLIRAVEPDIPGRLVVFFPGQKKETSYRLLNARDGWNYLAQTITLDEADDWS